MYSQPEPASQTQEELLAHEPYLRRVALALTRGDHSAADDLLQETWLAALAHPPSQPGRLRPWLGQVLRNRARLRLRSRVRRGDREASVASSGVELRTPQRLVADEQIGEALRDALAALPETYAELLALRFFEGLPPRHIAARMDLPVETVRTRLRRGTERLRARLLPEDTEQGRQEWLAGLAAYARPAIPDLARGLVPAWLGIALGLGALLLLLGLGLWPNPPAAPALAPPAAKPEAELAQALAEPEGPTMPAQERLAETAPSAESGEWTFRVLDAQGRPAPDAEVLGRLPESDFLISKLGSTDERGELRRSRPAQPMWVAARGAEGTQRSRALWLDGTQPQATLILLPADSLRVRVLDEAGEPLAEALGRLVPERASWWSQWDSQGQLSSEAWWFTARSDSDGWLELAGAGGRPWVLEVEGEGYARWYSDRFRRPDQDPSEVRLQPEAILIGRVRGVDGRPVSGAQVLAQRRFGELPLAQVVSDADGQFVLGTLPRGPLRIVAHSGQHSARCRVDTRTSPARIAPLTLARESSLVGRLRDAQGLPLASRQLRLAPIQGLEAGPHPALRQGSEALATTDAEGAFAFHGIDPGDHRLLVMDAEGRQPRLARPDARAGEPLDLRLDGDPANVLGSLTLRLAAPLTGELWIQETSLQWSLRAPLEDSRECVMEGLLPGTYELALFRSGQVPAELGQVRVRPGQGARLDIQGPPTPARVMLRAPQLEPGLDTQARLRLRSTGSARMAPLQEQNVRLGDLAKGIVVPMAPGDLLFSVRGPEGLLEAKGTATSGADLELEFASVRRRPVMLHLPDPQERAGQGPITVEVFDRSGASVGQRLHRQARNPNDLTSKFSLVHGSYTVSCVREGVVLAERVFSVGAGRGTLDLWIDGPKAEQSGAQR